MPECSKFIPDAWKTEGISSAPLPVENTTGALGAFGIAQTGQLDKSNERTFDVIQITTQCEAEFKKAQVQIEKSWWEFWK